MITSEICPNFVTSESRIIPIQYGLWLGCHPELIRKNSEFVNVHKIIIMLLIRITFVHIFRTKLD